jgi:hypothetical protein
MSGVPSAPYIPTHLLLNPPPRPKTSPRRKHFPVFKVPVVPTTNTTTTVDEFTSTSTDLSNLTQSNPKRVKLSIPNIKRPVRTFYSTNLDPNPNPLPNPNSWRCSTCLSWSFPSKPKCYFCGSNRPVSTCTALRFTDINPNDTGNPLAWRCPYCKVWNFPGRPVCYRFNCNMNPRDFNRY